MSQQERWDVVLKAINGPQAVIGDQTYRGPVVRLGANPGPGGFKLTGYRGVDARQCVITAYDGGTISVAPVGNNQIRMAPHAHVNWKDIDPIRGAEYLSKGCALHLGPVGRGATLEFVECKRLGVWETGSLASEAADVPGQRAAPGAPPTSYDARRVGNVQASNAPFWFLGCTFFMSSATAVAVLLVGSILLLDRDVADLGPQEPGYDLYDSVDLSTSPPSTELLEGLHRPFYEFVMAPNSVAAGAKGVGLDKAENWDQVFLQYTTASVEQHVKAWNVFRRLDAIRREYGSVVTQLRAAGLPEVFAAIPYQESRYKPSYPSEVCADGYWQFMPEVALRVERMGKIPFKVRDCRFKGTEVKWSPQLLTPPRNAMKNAEYMDEGVCRITSCDVDDRTDLAKSTAAAIYTLGEAYNDPTLRQSGALVQLTIASHNTGYDDSRFGVKKSTNVLPAYAAFVKSAGAKQGSNFYGSSIRCGSHLDSGRCGSVLMGQTQHYVYPIVAQHLIAVCYYAQNYGEDTAFKPWNVYTRADGYCRQFKIPSKAEVLRNKGGG
ncbi:MAG: hypothetical protein GWP91_02025 [Rhodobacterales bacterium]|nr:hypothetical protein [Rhodobacterales bacterium]